MHQRPVGGGTASSAACWVESDPDTLADLDVALEEFDRRFKKLAVVGLDPDPGGTGTVIAERRDGRRPRSAVPCQAQLLHQQLVLPGHLRVPGLGLARSAAGTDPCLRHRGPSISVSELKPRTPVRGPLNRPRSPRMRSRAAAQNRLLRAPCPAHVQSVGAALGNAAPTAPSMIAGQPAGWPAVIGMAGVPRTVAECRSGHRPRRRTGCCPRRVPGQSPIPRCRCSRRSSGR